MTWLKRAPDFTDDWLNGFVKEFREPGLIS